MDDEFPKTLNSALSIAGKVHGSITDLVKILGDLQADLAGLEPAMNMALAAMKAAPPSPVDAPPIPPGPIAAAKPAVKPAVSEGTKAEPSVVKPVHIATSTPE